MRIIKLFEDFDQAPVVKVGDKVDVASYGLTDDDDMLEEGCEVLKVRDRNHIEVRLTSDPGIVCLCEWRGEWVTIENLEG